MRTLIKIMICAIAAIAGYGAALLAAMLALGSMGVSAFEGERATLAAFVFGPIGALGGLWAGGWAAQRIFQQPTRFGSVARVAGAAFVFINVMAAIGAIFGTLSLEGSRWTNGAPPRLDFEIRAADGVLWAGDGKRARVVLVTRDNQMPATLKQPFDEQDGRVTIAGQVELYYRTARRTLSFEPGDGRSLLFRLSIPATPSASTDWSQWTRVSQVIPPGEANASAPGPADGFEFRTRLTVY